MNLQPCYPIFATKASRQKSFDNNWSSTKVQTPRQLSEAVLYFITHEAWTIEKNHQKSIAKFQENLHFNTVT